MKNNQNKINRRNFLKTVGAAGIGSAFAVARAQTPPAETETPQKTKQPEYPQIPRRPLGKTGVQVPVLALGTMFNVLENQIMLRKTLQHGAGYWDTADCYSGGNSELGIGKFLAANPEKRNDLFIVTKSDSRRPRGIQKLLDRSLTRMQTDYIDLYFLHGVDDPDELTDKVKTWVAEAKASKKIRFFGFSTHSNMAKCLTTASKLGWIDAIMTTYNFRVMQDPKMQAAVEACHKAGVGLIAMKTQAKEIKTKEDKRLADHFLQKGFTEGQAKIKMVLQDKRISAACVGRGNLSHLLLNIAAVLDKTKLTRADMDVFAEYAAATCDGYCAGCAEICAAAQPDAPYISKVMRCLMYYNSYGEKDTARQIYSRIPKSLRDKITTLDYTAAQARCPHRLPIGRLMNEAAEKLA